MWDCFEILHIKNVEQFYDSKLFQLIKLFANHLPIHKKVRNERFIGVKVCMYISCFPIPFIQSLYHRNGKPNIVWWYTNIDIACCKANYIHSQAGFKESIWIILSRWTQMSAPQEPHILSPIFQLLIRDPHGSRTSVLIKNGGKIHWAYLWTPFFTKALVLLPCGETKRLFRKNYFLRPENNCI